MRAIVLLSIVIYLPIKAASLADGIAQLEKDVVIVNTILHHARAAERTKAFILASIEGELPSSSILSQVRDRGVNVIVKSKRQGFVDPYIFSIREVRFKSECEVTVYARDAVSLTFSINYGFDLRKTDQGEWLVEDAYEITL